MDERGGVTAFVATIGALLMVLLLFMQLAIYGNVRNAVTIATRGAAERAAVLGSTASAGEEYGDGYLAASGGWVIDGDVTVNRGPDTTTAVGRARIFEVFPGFGGIEVSVDITTPTERIVGDR